MKKFLFAAAACAATNAFAAGAYAAETRTYDLSGFDRVSVAAGVSAEVTVGDDFAVRAETDKGDLDGLEIEVRGGVLEIGRRSSVRRWLRGQKVEVQVTLPELNGIDASSGAHVGAAGVDADGFVIDASSGAHVDVSGRCDALSLDVSSGAFVEARALECVTVSADSSSGAQASAFASERVTADASSGAMLRIYGGADDVRTDTSTGGSVHLKD